MLKIIFMNKENNFIFVLGLLCCLFLANACGKDDENKYDFKDQALSGKVKGNSFSVRSGYFYTDYTDEEQDWAHIKLFNMHFESEKCYRRHRADYYEIYISIPNEVSTYTPGVNGAFVLFTYVKEEGEESITYVEEGKIEILTQTEDTLTGRIVAIGGDDNNVNGNFNATFCGEIN